MNFTDLPIEKKEELHREISEKALQMGGKTFFLDMIESLRNAQPNPLLNQNASFNDTLGSIKWRKSIYPQTLSALNNAMIKEEKEGDMLAGLKPKGYKETMNMMRTLRPIIFKVIPQDTENGESFSFPVLDTTEKKKTKVSQMFKIFFFYDSNFIKEALDFQR